MKIFLLGGAALLALAVADFLLYVSQDGMECQGDACSTVVDVTGALLVPLVALALLTWIVGAVRAVLRRGGTAA